MSYRSYLYFILNFLNFSLINDNIKIYKLLLGTYGNPDNYLCINCNIMMNCIGCSNNSTCYICADGYELNSNYSGCIQCPSNCNACKDS